VSNKSSAGFAARPSAVPGQRLAAEPKTLPPLSVRNGWMPLKKAPLQETQKLRCSQSRLGAALIQSGWVTDSKASLASSKITRTDFFNSIGR
jgi:hypothetical protein